MSADQLATRILSTVTQTNGHKMRTGELDNAEFTRIAAAVRELEKLPLYIDDTPGLNINTIRTRARRLKRNKGLGLIVIDYIQLIMGTGSKKTEGNRVQELSEISRGLKILAKELNVPVIALSQLNRGVEQRDDKRPVMSDLRESGSIEQDADIVMFVYRENYYIQNEEPQQKASETPEHLQNALRNGKPASALPPTSVKSSSENSAMAPPERFNSFGTAILLSLAILPKKNTYPNALEIRMPANFLSVVYAVLPRQLPSLCW